MKIINDGFPSGDEVLLDKITCIYIQESDSTESSDEVQEITLSTRDCGGGKFLNISTKSWSISNAEELTNLINDFENRMNYEISNNS